MQDIIKEYGPAMISVVVVIALISLITVLVGTDATSVVGRAFSDLITSFIDSANNAAGL